MHSKLVNIRSFALFGSHNMSIPSLSLSAMRMSHAISVLPFNVLALLLRFSGPSDAAAAPEHQFRHDTGGPTRPHEPGKRAGTPESQPFSEPMAAHLEAVLEAGAAAHSMQVHMAHTMQRAFLHTFGPVDPEPGAHAASPEPGLVFEVGARAGPGTQDQGPDGSGKAAGSSARRRFTMTGEGRESVRSQLAGLRRRAVLKSQWDKGGPPPEPSPFN